VCITTDVMSTAAERTESLPEPSDNRRNHSETLRYDVTITVGQQRSYLHRIAKHVLINHLACHPHFTHGTLTDEPTSDDDRVYGESDADGDTDVVMVVLIEMMTVMMIIVTMMMISLIVIVELMKHLTYQS